MLEGKQLDMYLGAEKGGKIQGKILRRQGKKEAVSTYR